MLFVDRMSETGQLACKESLDAFATEFDHRRELGEIESNEKIAARLAEYESRYC